MRIHLMRHGQTNYNLAQLCNDDPKCDVRLTPEGRAQAEEAAERLRTTPLQYIYTSQLPRTQETAMIVNRHHRVAIETHAALNDLRSGFEGRPVLEHEAAIAADPLHIRPEGGESLLEHKARVLTFFDWLERQPHFCVLVVAHEETLRVFSAHVKQLPDEEMFGLSFPNCAIVSAEIA